MKLDLDRQGSGRTRLEVDERLATGAEEPLPAEVELRGCLTVDNLEGRILVTGSLEAATVAVCDRCLEDFACRFTAPVEITVLRAPSFEGELDPWVIHQRSGEVDLDEPLREAALLGLPQKLLCDESCRGLCLRCGANLNLETCGCSAGDADPGRSDPTAGGS